MADRVLSVGVAEFDSGVWVARISRPASYWAEWCPHRHRSERTALQCAEKRLRKAQKEGAG